jgi:hypothetical protein
LRTVLDRAFRSGEWRVDLVGVEPTPLGLKTRLAPTRPGPLIGQPHRLPGGWCRGRAGRMMHRTRSLTCPWARTVFAAAMHLPPFRRTATEDAEGKYWPGASEKLNCPAGARSLATAAPNRPSSTGSTVTVADTTGHFRALTAHASTVPLSCPLRAVACVDPEPPHPPAAQASPTAVAVAANPRGMRDREGALLTRTIRRLD